MYRNFFGFKERPFQLVPNPAYLFLSRDHEEAMAHLTYAMSQGDGFVEITGEVGTGKTTLCRAFLENLDHHTEAAYIFNPKLDSIQLLKAINDEFGISSDADNTKDLIDNLNSFLLEEKAEGKKVILLIDEAQNLSKEVLEQLRLLSNLETTTSKLLQIILVGQPELGEMLDSHELRQLGQRITLSCHLSPLSYKETREYICHRINIASRKPGIRFDRAAFHSIYKYSGGTPRLINIACDQALLTAFGLNRHKITGNIARASIRELAGRGDVKLFSLFEGRKATLFLCLICLALFIVIFYNPGNLDLNGLFKFAGNEKPKASESKPPEMIKPVKSSSFQKPVKAQEKSEPDQRPIEEPEKYAPAPKPVEDIEQVAVEMEPAVKSVHVQDLGDILEALDSRSSRRLALKAAMERWNTVSGINPDLENIENDQVFFRLAAKQNGLLILRIKNDLNLLKKLNLPAILKFDLHGDQPPRYLTVSKIDDKKINLKGGGEDGVIEVKQDEVVSYWSGVAYIPWKNFLNYIGTIPSNAPRDSIITLKMLLKDLGFNEIEISPFYDDPTEEAVKKIQERHGISVDGIVGPLTKIVLYNEKNSLKIPHIIPPIERKSSIGSF